MQGDLEGLQWQNFGGMGSLPSCDVRMGRTGGELDYLYTPSAAELGASSPQAVRLQALRYSETLVRVVHARCARLWD